MLDKGELHCDDLTQGQAATTMATITRVGCYHLSIVSAVCDSEASSCDENALHPEMSDTVQTTYQEAEHPSGTETLDSSLQGAERPDANKSALQEAECPDTNKSALQGVECSV